MSSTPPASAQNAPLTERTVRRLLTSRKPDDAATLQDWLDHPPSDQPEVIVSLLARIAKDARNFATHARLFVKWIARGLICVWLCLPSSYLAAKWFGLHLDLNIVVLSAGFGVICWIMGGKILPRGANRAALLLARINDARAVQHLADLWTPRPLTRAEAAFNADVTRELTRLLTARQGDRYGLPTENALRQLVKRAFPGGALVRAWRQVRHTSDLTEADTDLLLAVVRHLTHHQPKKAGAWAQEDGAALRRVTLSPASGTHYVLLRDTTQALLASAGTRTP